MSKKIWAIIATIIIVVAGSAFLLQLDIQSMQTPVRAEVVDNQAGLMVTLQLEKTIYRLGEPVNVTLTITNISNQTITFMFCEYFVDFLVYNASKNIIYQYSKSAGVAFPDICGSIPLNPQENLAGSFIWPQTSGLTWSQVPVSPGTYYIVGLFLSNITLQTTPIQITIIRVIER
jgi:hypothetical protein